MENPLSALSWPVHNHPAIKSADGQRLHALTGRRLSHAWLLWDFDADEWFSDAPVLLDFDGAQVEIDHRKFDDLSITWNTITPATQTSWTRTAWNSASHVPATAASVSVTVRLHESEAAVTCGPDSEA